MDKIVPEDPIWMIDPMGNKAVFDTKVITYINRDVLNRLFKGENKMAKKKIVKKAKTAIQKQATKAGARKTVLKRSTKK